MPLVLDAPSWGQDIDMLQATGPALIKAESAAQPHAERAHVVARIPWGNRALAELAESVALELPLIVGEFAQHAVYMCDQAPFAFEVLLEQAASASIGWLAWSWGGVANNDCKQEGPFDMTSNGKFETLSDWGEKVAVSGPYSIKNTSSRRPTSLTTGSCP